MRPTLICVVALSLSACLPVLLPAPGDLLKRGRVPEHLGRPLTEGPELAHPGSAIITCQCKKSWWGFCTHATSKVTPQLLSDETGALALPGGALSVASNRLVWVGVRHRGGVRGLNLP